ncbi:MAG: serine/threonine protein kinase [Planctomycetes bacterium]|nr:serine/threonine protein kinase [Planctomycetota bacterium]
MSKRPISKDRNNQEKIDSLFARFCLDENLVSKKDIDDCLALRKKNKALWGLVSLQDLLIDLGYLSEAQVERIVYKHEREVLGCIECNAIFRVKDPEAERQEPWVCKRCGGELAQVFKADLSFDTTLYEGGGGSKRRDRKQLLPLQTGKPFGKYEILREIGDGGMGRVYQAIDRETSRPCAIKVLHPEGGITWEDVKRFQHEIRSIQDIQHPNIVSIHEVGTHEGRHYYAMDYIEGHPLKDVIEKEESLDVDRALQITRKLASALHAAHEKGIIHRDIKPDNVILTEDGEPHLLDFSIAKIFAEVTQVTKIGTALGTPVYMAPEQAAGHIDELDATTDVYSLGVLLYEMLTGLPPFHGRTIIEILDAVEGEKPIPPRELNSKIPEPVNRVAMKAMEKKKHNRYASAREFADDIDRFLAGEPIRAGETGFLGKVMKRFGK